MHDQWIRKVGLFVFSEENALDLSNMHIRFSVDNADVESPNNATMRVYNLSKDTINTITKNSEFKSVSLNAGYENGNYGTIFQGTIKQFRIGKENATDTYLDILASDGDIGYNQGFLNETLAKGTTQTDAINSAAKAMGMPVDYGVIKSDLQHLPSIRGKVRFGMARAFVRNSANTLDSGWSIQNGRIQVIGNSGYLDDQIVELNSATGLIGVPEQTDEGVRLRCLLNSKLRIGSLVHINNSIVNQLSQASSSSAQVAYNSYTQIQPLAPLSDDGIYRIFVVEHDGDTRGTNWYSNLVGLAFDTTNNATLAM